jgi:RNA polymerase sigma-70 factor (ECF subfamily)
MFNEGYLASEGRPMRRDLSEDATWLASLVCHLLPKEPEAKGLLALMKLHLSRVETRFDGHELVLLPNQDRSRWNHTLIHEATDLIAQAAAVGRVGPFQVEAAIAAVHAEAPRFEATDWRQIVALYDLLLTFGDSPVVRLNRAVALRAVAGPEAALWEVDALHRSSTATISFTQRVASS